MKKTIIVSLIICCLLFSCVFLFSSCDLGGDEFPNLNGDKTEEKENNEKGEQTAENQAQTTENHEHVFGEWQTTSEPTCTENGQLERSCSCGEREYSTVNATGHYEVVDEAVDATCLETGLTEGKHCARCNEILIPQETVDKLGHKAVLDKAVSATCTKNGLTEGYHCERCKYVIVQQSTIYAQHTVVTDSAVEPTCTESGLTEGSHCSVCNTVLTQQRTDPAKGHSYSENVISPSCTEKGYTEYTCKRCSDYYIGNERDALGHSLDDDAVCKNCKGDFSVDMISRVGAPITTSNHSEAFAWCYDSNYDWVDAVLAHWQSQNLTGKTIKYITVQLKYYNAAGDSIYASTYKKTGPIYHGETIEMEMIISGKSYGFYMAIKNGETITAVELSRITIEYSDGTTEIGKYGYFGEEVDKYDYDET